MTLYKDHTLALRQGAEVELVDLERFSQLTDRLYTGTTNGPHTNSLQISALSPAVWPPQLQTWREDVPWSQEEWSDPRDHAGQEKERSRK